MERGERNGDEKSYLSKFKGDGGQQDGEEERGE